VTTSDEHTHNSEKLRRLFQIEEEMKSYSKKIENLIKERERITGELGEQALQEVPELQEDSGYFEFL